MNRVLVCDLAVVFTPSDTKEMALKVLTLRRIDASSIYFLHKSLFHFHSKVTEIAPMINVFKAYSTLNHLFRKLIVCHF